MNIAGGRETKRGRSPLPPSPSQRVAQDPLQLISPLLSILLSDVGSQVDDSFLGLINEKNKSQSESATVVSYFILVLLRRQQLTSIPSTRPSKSPAPYPTPSNPLGIPPNESKNSTTLSLTLAPKLPSATELDVGLPLKMSRICWWRSGEEGAVNSKTAGAVWFDVSRREEKRRETRTDQTRRNIELRTEMEREVGKGVPKQPKFHEG